MSAEQVSAETIAITNPAYGEYVDRVSKIEKQHECSRQVAIVIERLERERDQYKRIAQLNHDTIVAMQDAKDTWETLARRRSDV
jgi:hypothetical protein